MNFIPRGVSMKKILLITLAAGLGFGSMQAEATNTREPIGKLTGRTAYIMPALRVGFGVCETVFGTYMLYAGYDLLPQEQRKFRKRLALNLSEEDQAEYAKLREKDERNFLVAKCIKKLPEERQKEVAYTFVLEDIAGTTAGPLGVVAFVGGITDIVFGLDKLKSVYRIRKFQKNRGKILTK